MLDPMMVAHSLQKFKNPQFDHLYFQANKAMPILPPVIKTIQIRYYYNVNISHGKLPSYNKPQ